MNKFLLVAAIGGFAVGAAEQTVTVPPTRGGNAAPVQHQKDPQQSRLEPTTQIRGTNTAGAAAPRETGSSSVDKDIQQRVLVSLSTGTVGTQGILASNQLTDIKVTVTNRQVTLRGDVMSQKSKETIGKRVAGLDGVKGVNNELTVSGKAHGKHPELAQPDGYSQGTGAKK